MLCIKRRGDKNEQFIKFYLWHSRQPLWSLPSFMGQHDNIPVYDVSEDSDVTSKYNTADEGENDDNGGLFYVIPFNKKFRT
ncbi:hypothetical protein RclHR1_00090027 [Rhizophagus clarus]|uniref:Uncharacterized protein n=1 Tax=Rhizophagus clarus TaxID=94130 RepID=A0A2Z6S902_9GLOM|nr:hypothetical protein RclHR1_00090027 [Rhizophagus clarus]